MLFEEWWGPWAEEIEEKTNGMVKPEIYPFGALGYSPTQQLVLLEAGVLDASDVLCGWSTGHFPDLGVLDLPALFRTSKECTEALETTWPIWQREFPKRFGAYPIMYYAHEEQVFLSAKKLTSLDDLKGQKLRTFASLQDAILEAAGATGIYVSYGEQYAAMQRGVVDGACTGAVSHLKMKHYEVSDYIWYGTGMAGFAATLTAVSERQWSQLPDDVKLVILEVSEKYRKMSLEMGDRWLTGALKELEGHGMTVTRATDEDYQEIRRLAEEEVWPEWSAEHSGTMGRALLAAILEAQK